MKNHVWREYRGKPPVRFQSVLPHAFKLAGQPENKNPALPTNHDAQRGIVSNNGRPTAKPVSPALADAFKNPFFYCDDCERVTWIAESDQGLTNKCGLCGSVRVRLHPPLVQTV